MRSTPTTVVTSRRSLPFSLAAAVALTLASQSAPAADLFWNANPTVSLWNQTDTSWTPDSFASVKWDNSVPDSATFDGTGVAGTVTLGEDITVKNITFNAAGYTIAGGGHTLTLSNTTIGGTASATISANLAGTGLTITNSNASGILLSGNNTYTGTTIIGSGSNTTGAATLLRVGNVGAFGNSTDIRVGNTAVMIISVPNATSTSVGSGKTLTIYGSGPGNNGALRGTDGASNTWAGNVVIGVNGSRMGGGNGGTLTISGVISEASPNSSVLFSRLPNSTTVLNAVNTYTGDTQLFNNATNTVATLKIGVDNAINANSRFTTLGVALTSEAALDLNGHILTLRGLDTSATTSDASSANLVVKNNGGTASTLTVGDSTAANRYTFGGIIKNGTSEVSLVKAGNNTQVLAANNTYTGSTTVNGGTLQVGAPAPTSGSVHFKGENGALASTDIRVNNGSFAIDNTGTNNNSSTRLADSANVTLNGGTSFVYRGSELATSQETLGKFTFANGISTINLVHGTGNAAVVTVGELNRSTGGGLGFLSGADFGSTAAAASRLIVTNAPALVGTSDALATGVGTAKDTKIVPFLVGTTNGSTADTFVTYNPTTGLRPLSTEEYENDIVAGANVRIVGNKTSGTTAAINSLTVTGVTLTLSGTVTNTSGAFLFTTGTSNVSGGTIALGNTEALMTVSGTTAVFASKITGSNGLTFFGPGTLGLGSTTSTYTGETMLYSGIIVPQVSSSGSGAGTTGPFGASTVVFAGSQIRTGTAVSDTPTTIGNDVRIQADTTITFNGGTDLKFTGPVTLADGTRTLTNGTSKNTIFSGTIGDGGQEYGLAIAGSGTGSVILEGDNTYTGPTTVRSSTLNISGSLSGNSAVSVNSGGTLVLSGQSFFRFGEGRISDSKALTLGSAGSTGSASLKIDNSFDSESSVPFEETIGSLSLAGNAVLDLGTGSMGTILQFAASQGNLWSGTLSIYNWTGTVGVGGGDDQIFFGNNQFSLTEAQLAQITFYSSTGEEFKGSLLPTGELIAVAAIPEPASMLSLFAMFGGLLGGRRLRRRKSVEG